MTDRIRTTHVGRIQRPELITAALVAGRAPDAAFSQKLRDAVVDVVRQQVEAGIDIPNDGEFGHVAWNNYLKDRLGGFELRKRQDSSPSTPPTNQSRDRSDFPGFYAYMAST